VGRTSGGRGGETRFLEEAMTLEERWGQADEETIDLDTGDIVTAERAEKDE
jgi:hypothetical protein